MEEFIVATVVGLVIGILAATLITMGIERQPKDADARNAVYAVCDYSASVNSGEWEEACANVQDISSINYK